jgi:hypothetical protein
MFGHMSLNLSGFILLARLKKLSLELSRLVKCIEKRMVILPVMLNVVKHLHYFGTPFSGAIGIRVTVPKDIIELP